MTIQWWKAACVRAIKTVAQAAAAMLSVATLMGEVDWKTVASASLLAGIYSVVTSVKGLPEVKEK